MCDEISYGEFAYIYDLLTDDVEYTRRADYIDGLISKHFIGSDEKLLCDLGCGTGTICTILNERGYDCIGIDNSENMLNVALSKNNSENILYLNQDITEFELYGTVDIFVSLLDTLNYITDSQKLKKVFKLVYNYLNYDGIFIFDINTPYKFEHILADNTFIYEHDNIFYTWENFYEDKMLDFYLNFFIKGEDNKYRRFAEHHSQFCYSEETIINFALEAGLCVEAVYGEFSFSSPSDTEERLFFVLKKPSKA